MKQFVDLSQLSHEELQALLQLAQRLEQQPEPEALRGRVLGLLFMNPSLRTLASMQSAMGRLGGSSFVITPGKGTWGFETRPQVVMDGEAAEHIREAIPVLASYSDVLGIRAFAGLEDLTADLEEQTFNRLASLCDVPLMNLESAINHPCQALADWRTLDTLQIPRHGKFVLSWAWHPKALPLAVPTATLWGAAQRGMQVTVLRPEGYELPTPIMARARQLAALSGGSVSESCERNEALEGATVLYAKSWGSPRFYGKVEEERNFRSHLRHWCVSPDWFEGASPTCRFMHCLPVRRNVVVQDAVLDGPRSVVLQQARNRLWVQMAVLHQLLLG